MKVLASRFAAVAGAADIAIIMENSLSAASPFLIFLTLFHNRLKHIVRNRKDSPAGWGFKRKLTLSPPLVLAIGAAVK